ncbi:pyrimidine 5'-nucleotidase [Planktotalea sp.]|uniref:pyrimidine 5'-nucleotidase n=1 Tax=Planktotalea sp. TaxID=2029877 RepID=UPI003299F7C2
MPKQLFSHVNTWVFDLDNTLYPPEMCLFDQIEVRMIAYVMKTLGVDRERADYLRGHYWKTHGTTLAGLMREHDIDPEPYLIDVHDIDFTVLDDDPELRSSINALPGRKIVYTNGTAPYAQNVLKARGLDGIFAAIYGVEHANYHPKPDAAAFDTVFGLDKVPTETAAMFEDDPRNLRVPHSLGMRTVHVAPDALREDHIHHHTDDLATFLRALT